MNYYSDPDCLWLVFMFGPGFNVGNDSPASGLIGPWVQAMTVLISHPHLMDGSWVSWHPNPDQVGTEMNENNMVLALCMDIQIHAIMLHLTKINGEKLFEHGQKKEVDIWKGCQTCLIALHVPSAHIRNFFSSPLFDFEFNFCYLYCLTGTSWLKSLPLMLTLLKFAIITADVRQ